MAVGVLVVSGKMLPPRAQVQGTTSCLQANACPLCGGASTVWSMKYGMDAAELRWGGGCTWMADVSTKGIACYKPGAQPKSVRSVSLERTAAEWMLHFREGADTSAPDIATYTMPSPSCGETVTFPVNPLLCGWTSGITIVPTSMCGQGSGGGAGTTGTTSGTTGTSAPSGCDDKNKIMTEAECAIAKCCPGFTCQKVDTPMFGWFGQCKPTISGSQCGDGIVQEFLGEQCDNGKALNGDQNKEGKPANSKFGQCCTDDCEFVPKLPNGKFSTCRPAVKICDVPEKCSGNSATCPPDAFKTNTVKPCRPTKGSCDQKEFCTGTSAFCPVNGFQPDGTFCGSNGVSGVCQNKTCVVHSGAACSNGKGDDGDGVIDADDWGCYPSLCIECFEHETGKSIWNVTTEEWKEYAKRNNYAYDPTRTSELSPCEGGPSIQVSLLGRFVGFLIGQNTAQPCRSYCCVNNNNSWGCVSTVGRGSSCRGDLYGNNLIGQNQCNLACQLHPPLTCGNGTLDPGEQCDRGVCCSGCRFINDGRVCRPAGPQCDVAESCTGQDGRCPADLFAPAGAQCTDPISENPGRCRGGNTICDPTPDTGPITHYCCVLPPSLGLPYQCVGKRGLAACPMPINNGIYTGDVYYQPGCTDAQLPRCAPLPPPPTYYCCREATCERSPIITPYATQACPSNATWEFSGVTYTSTTCNDANKPPCPLPSPCAPCNPSIPGFCGSSLSCLRGKCRASNNAFCAGDPPYCGDGVRAGTEACDGSPVGCTGGNICNTQCQCIAPPPLLFACCPRNAVLPDGYYYLNDCVGVQNAPPECGDTHQVAIQQARCANSANRTCSLAYRPYDVGSPQPMGWFATVQQCNAICPIIPPTLCILCNGNGNTCGALQCINGRCRQNTSNRCVGDPVVPLSVCGNGVREGSEACDGSSAGCPAGNICTNQCQCAPAPSSPRYACCIQSMETQGVFLSTDHCVTTGITESLPCNQYYNGRVKAKLLARCNCDNTCTEMYRTPVAVLPTGWYETKAACDTSCATSPPATPIMRYGCCTTREIRPDNSFPSDACVFHSTSSINCNGTMGTEAARWEFRRVNGICTETAHKLGAGGDGWYLTRDCSDRCRL